VGWADVPFPPYNSEGWVMAFKQVPVTISMPWYDAAALVDFLNHPFVVDVLDNEVDDDDVKQSIIDARDVIKRNLEDRNKKAAA
jgi:hypothetical protein